MVRRTCRRRGYLLQPLDGVVRAGRNRVEHRASDQGPARHRAARESAVTDQYINPIEGNARLLVQYLRKDCICTSAHVLGSTAHAKAAVGAELDGRSARQPHCYPACAGESPAQDLALTPHGSNTGRTLLPPELPGAGVVALFQVTRGEGHILVALVLVGIVETAQLQ